jgi:glycosyltransferase involved in cell wall biosynthesis
MKQTVTVIIPTRNSEKTLEDTLHSVQTIADEIHVYDMKSADSTRTIAQKYNAKITSVDEYGYADPVRQTAIQNAKTDWVFFVDADETVPKTLADKLQALKEDETIDGIFIPRKNMLLGEWASSAGWWPDYILRFMRQKKAHWPKEVHGQPYVDGKTVYLPAEEQYAFLHQNYTTLEEFIDRMNIYTTLEAKQQKPINETLFQHILHEYLRRYYAWDGKKLGEFGEKLSGMQALYQGFVWLKQNTHTNQEVKKLSAQLHELAYEAAHWESQEKIQSEQSHIKRILLKTQRKLFGHC